MSLVLIVNEEEAIEKIRSLGLGPDKRFEMTINLEAETEETPKYRNGFRLIPITEPGRIVTSEMVSELLHADEEWIPTEFKAVGDTAVYKNGIRQFTSRDPNSMVTDRIIKDLMAEL